MAITPPVSRRSVLAGAGVLATAATLLDMTGALSVVPSRAYAAEPADITAIPDIQFDTAAFTAPAEMRNGVLVAMPPVHTMFLTARLLRKPNRIDQIEMQRVLGALEVAYPWSAAGLITFVSYGLPYVRRFSSLLTDRIIPRLRSDLRRFALEEAVPAPTDVHASNPGIRKVRFNVPVVIERNEVLFTLRSDNSAILSDVIAWFNGSNRLRGQVVRSPAWGGLVSFTGSRHMFAQSGLPRRVAQQNNLPFTGFMQPDSPMWMGFADQQVNASGPPQIVTFAGNAESRMTTADRGDYFDNGSIQHFSHVILDMLQFFDMAGPTAEPGDDAVFLERVQYMFHTPPPSNGFDDPLTDGGGPSFLPNENKGPNHARLSASGQAPPPPGEEPERRMGHLSTLQRSSRTAGGTPIHIRIDGPGFDNLDVPGGRNEPKLQFSVFVPTADFFARMRRDQASLDLQEEFDVEVEENGLERFLTATRRQNFLVPPRRNRSFPLAEF